MKIGFIGAGNMATAIIKGMIASGAVQGRDIIAYDPARKRLEALSGELGVKAAESNEVVIQGSDFVFLAVKPNYIAPVVAPLSEEFRKHKPVVISIAAATTMDSIAGLIGEPKTPIIRILPNFGVQIREGLVAFCHNGNVGEEKLGQATKLLTSLGRVIPLAEKMLTTFSSVGAASYAFTLMYIEALAKAGVKEGLFKPQSLEIAAQAVMGIAKLLLETGEHPYVVIDKVCSPGGTTICGVKALEDGAFMATVMNAVAATSARDLEILSGK